MMILLLVYSSGILTYQKQIVVILLPFWNAESLNSFNFCSYVHSRFYSHIKYRTITTKIICKNNYFEIRTIHI